MVSSAAAVSWSSAGARGSSRPAGLLRRARQLADDAEHPLLGAVVEVPFDPTPDVVAGLDDPGPGGAQLRDLMANDGQESLVVGGKQDGVAELRRDACVGRCRGVEHDGDELAGPADLPVGSGGPAQSSAIDGPAVDVHEPPVGHRVDDSKGGIGQCSGQTRR